MCDFIGTYSEIRTHSRSEHSFRLYETRLEKEKGEECSTFAELGEESSEESTFSIGHSALTSSLVDLCMPGNSEESNDTFILSSDGMIPYWSLLPQLDYPRLPIIRQGNNFSSDGNSCSWSLQNGSHHRPQFQFSPMPEQLPWSVPSQFHRVI